MGQEVEGPILYSRAVWQTRREWGTSTTRFRLESGLTVAATWDGTMTCRPAAPSHAHEVACISPH